MQFTRAIPFQEAIDKLGERSVIGSKLKSGDWADVPLALRERAYFSSTVESVRVLQRGKDAIGDFLTAHREVLPNGQIALATGSRQQFVKEMQEFMRAEGIIRQHGGVTDVSSQRRLELIFDTQTRAAQDYGTWKQGQDPDVLDEFPAQRFIRLEPVQDPRDSHAPFEDAVRLKSDLEFWTRLNEDFGVPWGPWGWGCGHDVEDVDREEAQALGLIKPGEHARPVEKDFNDRLAASTRGLDADLQRTLKEAFGDQVVIDGDEARWAGGNRPVPKPTPKPPPPAVEKPAPTPAPATGATTSLPVWKRDLDALVNEARTVEPGQQVSLGKKALEAIAIPAAARGQLSLAKSTRNSVVMEAARKGAQAVEQFVHPDLVNRTKLAVHTTRSGRAFHRNGQIHLTTRGSVKTAAHEIMHGIELQNPEVLTAARAFLLKRGAGEVPERLSKLTGIGYSSSERAFKDRWKERGGDVYAGKVYSWHDAPSQPDQIRATEIFTMGIERMMTDPLDFYRSDPEWFELMMTVLRRP